jgi:hypothetical protein
MGWRFFHGAIWISSCLGAIAAQGCAAAGDEPGDEATQGEVQQDILNGQVPQTNDHGVVKITTANGLCTGTMLTHFWVLTAKQCVDGVAQTGATVALNGVNGTSQAIVRHPSQGVALIVLSAAMPINGQSTGYALPIYTGSNASLEGQTLDCWGFGDNTPSGGAGTLRHAPLEVVSTTSSTLNLAFNANGQLPWTGDTGGTCFTTAGELRATGVQIISMFNGIQLVAIQTGPQAYRSWLLSLPFNESPPMVADFDGDHRGDLVFAWDGDPGLILQSARLAPGVLAPRTIDRLPDGAPIWNEGPPLVGDFSGDGKDDIAFAWFTGTGLEIRTKISLGDGSFDRQTDEFSDGEFIWNRGQPLVGDFNRDGKDDIVFAFLANQGLRILTKRSSGDGTYTELSQQFSEGSELWNQGPPLVGDFNGDGRDDIAFAYRSEGGKLQVVTKLSREDGTYASIPQSFNDGADLWNKGQPLVGDVNGDGRADIIFAFAIDTGALQVRTKLSAGDGTYTAVSQTFTEGEELWNRGPPMVGDISGDGRADLVFAWFAEGDGLQIVTKRSTGTGLWSSPPSLQLPDGDFIWNRGGPKLTDTDGDGRADLVFATEHTGRVFLRVKRSLGNGQYTASQANL